MEPTSVVDIEALKWTQSLYFAGGITVIILGAIGVIIVILAVLQIRFMKPYRNRYPYEEFGSFEEFAKKKPARPLEAPHEMPDPEETLRRMQDKANAEPLLTWDNAADEIPSLSAEEYKILQECAIQAKDMTDIPESEENNQFEQEEPAEELEDEKIPSF